MSKPSSVAILDFHSATKFFFSSDADVNSLFSERHGEQSAIFLFISKVGGMTKAVLGLQLVHTQGMYS